MWKYEGNKQILEKINWNCIFCKKRKNYIELYVTECKKTKDWFIELGMNKEKIVNRFWEEKLDITKDKISKKLWRERKREREREERDKELKRRGEKKRKK